MLHMGDFQRGVTLRVTEHETRKVTFISLIGAVENAVVGINTVIVVSVIGRAPGDGFGHVEVE